MRILFVTAHPYLPQLHGGMQRSADQLCAALIKRGHKVAVLAGLAGGGGLFAWKSRLKMQINKRLSGCKVTRDYTSNYPVWRTWFPWEAIASVTDKEKPELIVVMAGHPARMAAAAKQTKIPILIQLQNVDFHLLGRRMEECRDMPSVANSRFTADKYLHAFGIKSGVIYPFIAAENYRTKTTRENVTMINPLPLKGGDIAVEIARLCPEIPFSFVESWTLSADDRQQLMQKLTGLSNVTLSPPQDDMHAIYGKCKILLAPSTYEEAYGRVATEAQLSGIPVIASTRGGLPEAVGPGGILLDPDQPIADWAAAVRKLWQDQAHYAELSAAALAYAERREMTFGYQIEAYEQAMLIAAGYTTPATRKIAILEAEGFHLHHVDGDEFYFAKEDAPAQREQQTG
jgi:glycosyltransferase involved in cell wall biosynthesis